MKNLVFDSRPSLEEIFNHSLQNNTINQIKRDLVEFNSLELKKIKFTRTTDDIEQYKFVKSNLELMYSLFPNFDWPLIRLCSIIKTWTKGFTGPEIINFTTTAFSINQTHDAFVYACRGILANFDSDNADSMIRKIMDETNDLQLRNIGNIFLSICYYEKGDFLKFENFISEFRNNKEINYNPYISIPVSTVFIEDEVPSEISKFSNIFDRHENFEKGDAKYIISCSSDFSYFKKYGEFMIKSFSKVCSHESILHISIIDGKKTEILEIMNQIKGRNVFITMHSQDLKINLGPIASLVRFIHIHDFLERYQIPIVIMDLDSVIIKPLLQIILDNDDSHIGSRILKKGVAAWEKYTGGFAIFYNTDITKNVARIIKDIAISQIRDDIDQWWIDQNCFEAGIRYALKNKNEVKVVDLYNTRDKYCIMPVGPENSKLYTLREAMKKLDK